MLIFFKIQIYLQMQKSNKLVCLLVILLTIHQCSAITLDEPISIQLNALQQFSYSTVYKISPKQLSSSSSQQSQSRILVVQLQSTLVNQYSQVSINISKSDIGSIAYCKSIRHVLCAIQTKLLVKDQEISIHVQSKVQGKYQLRVYVSECEKLDINYGRNFKIDMAEFIGKHYQMQLNNDQKSPQSIKMILQPQHGKGGYGHLTAKKGFSYTDSIQSTNLWEGAQGLFMVKTDYAGRSVMYITVIGQPYSIYSLSTEVLNKDHLDITTLPIQFNEFIAKSRQKKYHIKLNKTVQLNKQELVINFRIFSGNPQIIFYYDQGMKEAQKSKYYQYMADSKFVFTAQELKDRTNLYFRVRSNDHTNVMKIQCKIVKSEQVELLQQNAYNFHSISNTKYLYIPLNINDFFSNTNQSPSSLNIQLSVLNIFGSSSLQFSIGNLQQFACLPTCYNDKFKKVQYSIVNKIALKIVYKLVITKDSLRKNGQNNVLLIKLEKSNKKNALEQITIQYSLDGKIIELRENYALTQIIQKGKKKYYKFTPLQSTRSLKICVSKISGDIGISGSYTNFLTDQSPSSITALQNCVQFNSSQIMKSIYMKLYGIDKSKYAISVQVQHKQQIIITPVLETNQDVEYKVVINPLGSYIFVLHPLYAHLRVSYNSSQPIRLCLLKQQNNQNKGKNQCKGSERMNQVAGQLYDQLSHAQSRKLQVTNPSLKDSLQFRMKYHSGDYEHCQLKLLNKVYQQDIAANSCFEFELPQSQADYQFISKSFTFLSQKLSIILCQKQILKFVNTNQISITRSQLQTQCNNTAYKSEPKIQIIAQVPQNISLSYKFQFIMQAISSSKAIHLPLNIRYTGYGTISEIDPIGQFILQSQILTNLVINAKFINGPSSHFQMAVYAVNRNKINGHKNIGNGLEPIITKKLEDGIQINIVIMEVQAKKMCSSGVSLDFMQQCQLAVVLQPLQRKKIGWRIQYSIQFKTANRILKQYQPQSSRISTIGQSDIYNFYPNLYHPQSINLLGTVHLSTSNQQCAQVYINRLAQPSRASALVSSTQSLNFFQIDANAYIIQVEAVTEGCMYSIEVAMIENQDNGNSGDKSGKRKIEILHSGVSRDLKLMTGQVSYYVAMGAGHQWKVLFLRKSGDIRLYAIKWTDQIEKKVFDPQYKFSQLDFPIVQRFPNTLQLPNLSSDKHETYLIAISCDSDAVGSVMLQNSNQPIIIPPSKKVLFTLKRSASTIVHYLTPKSQVKAGHLHIQLIYGEVHMKAAFVSRSADKDQIIKRMLQTQGKCCTTGKNNIIQFDFADSKVYNVEYLEIVIEAGDNDEAIVQVSMQLNDHEILTEDIDKDVLNHITVSKQQKTVLKTKTNFKLTQIIVSIVEHHQSAILPANQTEQLRQQKAGIIIAEQQKKSLTSEKQKNSLQLEQKQSSQDPQKIASKNKPQTTNSQLKDKISLQNSTAVVIPLKKLQECLIFRIPEQQKEAFKLKNVSPVMDNVLALSIQWIKFSLTQPSQYINLKVLLKEECEVQQLIISVAPSINDKLTILKPWQWGYLKKQRNFAIASKGDFLIDVVSCAEPASAYIASSFSDLHKIGTPGYQKQPQLSNALPLANQPQVLKIKPAGPITYLSMFATQATIRVIQPNFETEQGIGYLKYEWGHFLYETDFQKLTILLQLFKRVSPTKTKIKTQHFVVRIFTGVNLINTNPQCLDLSRKLVFQRVFKLQQQRPPPQVVIGKEDLLRELDGNAENLFVSVDLVVVIEVPNGVNEVYKFLAPIQQLPVDIFNITRLSNKIIAFGIVIILAVIFGCLFLAQIFLKYVLPFLGRMNRSKNIEFVQEEVATDKQNSQHIPASSDRNERATTQLDSERAAATQTEQKLENQQSQTQS